MVFHSLRLASRALRRRPGFSALAVLTLLAVASSRPLEGLLFEIAPTDPITCGGLAGAVAALVVLASYIPARRAAIVAPAEALRLD